LRTKKKTVFTDRWLRSLRPLKPGDPGYRKYRWDATLPHFGIRHGGELAFYVGIRSPQTKKWIDRHLGDYPLLPLADARAKAREAIAAITEGRAIPLAEGGTFGDMAARYAAEVLPGKRTAKACEQMIDREFIPVIGNRPLASLTQDDCIALLKGIAERSPHAARKALSELKVMLGWAAFNRVDGLKDNPASGIPVKELLRGRSYTKSRDRVLLDAELRLVWQAADDAAVARDPFGHLIKALILSGQRLNELARASWGEIDDSTGCLLIPASRMKGKAAHALPLTRRMRALLEELPRFESGDFMFSTTYGKRPVSGFSKMKARLDRAIAAIGHVEDWQIHDLRRTARTGMSRAGVPVFDAELVIAHTQSGVHETYDRHRYQDEVLGALRKWEELLFDNILTPPPANIVSLRDAAV
jgi:integrase